MRFLIAVVAALVSAVSAETFTVLVGSNDTLTYSPESVVAKIGDTVAFRFLSKNHTVTQSSFAKPCEPLLTPGVDSGFQSVPSGATAFPEYSITIEDDKTPFWFFCSQTPHCSKGMVFAINPTPEKTYATFKATAMNSSAAGTSGSGTGSATAPGATGNSAQMLSGHSATLLATLGLVAGLVL